MQQQKGHKFKANLCFLEEKQNNTKTCLTKKSKQRNPHSRSNAVVLSQNFIFSKKLVFVLETLNR